MDIDDDDDLQVKKSYKCEEPVIDNLNIFYNSSTSKLVLWNKYQINIYKDTDLQSSEKIFVPEFPIFLLIASSNYLICLDCNGNMHSITLKFKSSTQKSLKIPSLPRHHCVKICTQYKEDHILSLKCEADTYFLCLHKMNTDLQVEKTMILTCDNEPWPLNQLTMDKHLLIYHPLNKDSFANVNKIFKIQVPFRNDYNLILLTLDKLNIYSCLFSANIHDDNVTLIKLYSCPSEICNMEIVESCGLHLIISLKMGTVIRLSLNDITKMPEIIHLNTALHRILILKDSLIYSDGNTMWKAEDIFSDIKFKQFFVKNTNDITKCGDQIVCTTFNKLIYKFSISRKSSYLHSETDEYCAAEQLLNNSDYLKKLFKEIDKNNDVIQKLMKERHYITALSLAKRQDLMKKAIESIIKVYDTYEEVSSNKCILTEDIKEYFVTDTWIFLISITNLGIYNVVNEIFANLSEDINIYITLLSLKKVLKTTCIKIEEPLKSVNYSIPIQLKNENEVNVIIKIVINIPGALDNKKSLILLYQNNILLTSEHFIKFNQKAVNSLKNCSVIEELVQKTSENQYGNMFEFTDTSKVEDETEYMYFIKLPSNYEVKLKSESQKYLTPKQISLIQQISSEEFLKSKKQLLYIIGNDRIKVSIHNDGFSNPLLKIASRNANIALNVRNFFGNVIYNDYGDCEPGKEFIGYSFYTTTENFQKAVKTCIERSANKEEFLPLMEQFEKNIIGALPL